MTFTCPDCLKDFTTQFPFGDSVICPYCHVMWETDWEEDYDNMWAWITGKKVESV